MGPHLSLATQVQILEMPGTHNTQGQGEAGAGAGEGVEGVWQGEEDVHSKTKLDEYLTAKAGLQRQDVQSEG